MTLLRKPHAAGSFYPSEPSEIREFCESYLSASGNSAVNARAVILPHAGYVYSGKTACLVLDKVQVPDTVVLIGPNHWGTGSAFAIYAQGIWETPLGKVPIASDLAASMFEASHDLKMDDKAHAKEHSLEVLVPMLQIKNPQFRMVPLIVGSLDFEELSSVAQDLGAFLASRKEKPLLVISNDMSHYAPDDITRKKDRYALDAILALDDEALLNAVQKHKITMCGLAPVYMLLVMHEALGITEAELVHYTTSAEASGDTSRVVGYAGFIFR